MIYAFILALAAVALGCLYVVDWCTNRLKEK